MFKSKSNELAIVEENLPTTAVDQPTQPAFMSAANIPGFEDMPPEAQAKIQASLLNHTITGIQLQTKLNEELGMAAVRQTITKRDNEIRQSDDRKNRQIEDEQHDRQSRIARENALDMLHGVKDMNDVGLNINANPEETEVIKHATSTPRKRGLFNW